MRQAFSAAQKAPGSLGAQAWAPLRPAADRSTPSRRGRMGLATHPAPFRHRFTSFRRIEAKCMLFGQSRALACRSGRGPITAHPNPRFSLARCLAAVSRKHQKVTQRPGELSGGLPWPTVAPDCLVAGLTERPCPHFGGGCM